MSDWVRTAPEVLETWPLRALQERRKELREKLGQWHRYASNEAAIKASLADVERELGRRRANDDGPGVGYGTKAPSTPVEYPDMPETRAAWLQAEAARREAAYFDEHPDERPKGGLVNVSTLLKAWFPVK